MLELWISRTKEYDRTTTLANSIYSQSTSNIALKCLHYWHQRKKDGMELAIEVETRYDSSRGHKVLALWIDKHRDLKELEKDSEDIRALFANRYKEQLYRQWGMKLFKIQSKQRDADEFFARSEKQRMRAYWRRWRDYQQAKDLTEIAPLGTRQRSHQLIVNDSTLILETPTRSGIKRVPLTSISQWRRHRALRAGVEAPKFQLDLTPVIDVKNSRGVIEATETEPTIEAADTMADTEQRL